MIKDKIRDHLLVARPYSFILVIVITVLANTIARQGLILDYKLFLDAFVALLWWSSFLFIGEMRKNKKIDINISFIALIMLTVILTLQNPISLFFLVISLFFLLMYTKKSKSALFGAISPFSRGLLTLSLFFIILSTNNVIIIQEFHVYYVLLISLFLTVVSQNLIGDVRDIFVDKYTFSVQYGKKISLLIAELCIFSIIILINNFLITFPLVIMFFTVLIHRNAYNLHRIHVLTSTFFLVNYLFSMESASLFLINLLFLATILNLTYDLVPRTLALKMGEIPIK